MRKHTTSRRAVLKTSGPIALLGIAGTTGLVSAANLEVLTDGSSDVTETTATLHGTLENLGGHDSAYVQFGFGTDPDSASRFTTFEEKTSTGSFSHGVSDLSSGTTYYFYARAESADGSEVHEGQTLEFTTASSNDDGSGGGDDPDEDLE